MQINVTVQTQTPNDIIRLAKALEILGGGNGETFLVGVDLGKDITPETAPAKEEKPKKSSSSTKKPETKKPDIDEKDLPSTPEPEPKQESAEDLTDDDLNFDAGATEIRDEELRAACTAKGGEIGREKVKAYIDATGHPSVVKIPQAERAAFLEGLNKLA